MGLVAEMMLELMEVASFAWAWLGLLAVASWKLPDKVGAVGMLLLVLLLLLLLLELLLLTMALSGRRNENSG